eukprot:2884506-Pleurochrysis_carterae.AAC.1
MASRVIRPRKSRWNTRRRQSSRSLTLVHAFIAGPAWLGVANLACRVVESDLPDEEPGDGARVGMRVAVEDTIPGGEKGACEKCLSRAGTEANQGGMQTDDATPELATGGTDHVVGLGLDLQSGTATAKRCRKRQYFVERQQCANKAVA